jgi:pyrroline-5-carboxylate reductase
MLPARYRVTVVGCGQLAASFLTGLLASGFPPQRCAGLRRSGQRQRSGTTEPSLALRGIEWTDDLACLPLEVVLLAVKPKDFVAVAESMRRARRRPGLLLSALARVPAAELAAAFTPSIAVVRCMPNLGLAARRSSTLVWPYRELRSDVRGVVDELFGAAGSIWPMASEAELDRATALSAAGIAYVARMALALVEAGRRLGMDDDRSQALTRELCVATGALLDAPAASPRQLMAAVASPGGMTERALAHLEQRGLDGSVFEAMLRSLELADPAEPKTRSAMQ